MSDSRRSGLQNCQTLWGANENWSWTAGSELENRIIYAPRFTKTVARLDRVAALPHAVVMGEEMFSTQGWWRSPAWHRKLNFKGNFNVLCWCPALNYFMAAAPWGPQCHGLMPRPPWMLQRGQCSLSQQAVKHPAAEKEGRPECHCSSHRGVIY